MASPLNARRDQREQDFGGGIPIFPREIHQIAASDRNNLPAIANPSHSLWNRWPVIRSAIRFVEPALKPFCEIADGRIPACWRCENVQMIWHRNRGQNSPLIELLEHNTAYIPRLSIGED